MLDLIESLKFTNYSTSDLVEMPKSIESCNEISWTNANFSIHDIESIRSISGMSTPANAKIINAICKSMNKDQLYLNVGTYKGFSLAAGMHNSDCSVIGIDNFSQFGGPRDECLAVFDRYARTNTKFYDMDYVEYLNSHSGIIDFYFYDGHHSYENQYKAMKVASPYFRSGTLIMIDDTNVPQVKQATFDALAALNFKWNVWFDIATAHNKHPTFWNGLLLLEIQ
jgi:predicted O-methyltransferase YrrM